MSAPLSVWLAGVVVSIPVVLGLGALVRGALSHDPDHRDFFRWILTAVVGVPSFCFALSHVLGFFFSR